MPTTRRVVKRKATPPDLDTVVREYLLNRSMRERSSVHESTLKAGLMQVLSNAGTEDPESGHREIILDDPQPYTSYKGTKGVRRIVRGIQRQKRRGSMILNEERVMKFLEGLRGNRRSLYDACTMTITVINEDALLAANFEGAISDDELKALYDESDPTYAFHLLED